MSVGVCATDVCGFAWLLLTPLHTNRFKRFTVGCRISLNNRTYAVECAMHHPRMSNQMWAPFARCSGSGTGSIGPRKASCAPRSAPQQGPAGPPPRRRRLPGEDPPKRCRRLPGKDPPKRRRLPGDPPKRRHLPGKDAPKPCWLPGRPQRPLAFRRPNDPRSAPRAMSFCGSWHCTGRFTLAHLRHPILHSFEANPCQLRSKFCQVVAAADSHVTPD